MGRILVCFNYFVFNIRYRPNAFKKKGPTGFNEALFDVQPCRTVRSDLLLPLCPDSPVIRLNVLSLCLLSLVLPKCLIQRQMKAGHLVVGCITDLRFPHSFKSLLK